MVPDGNSGTPCFLFCFAFSPGLQAASLRSLLSADILFEVGPEYLQSPNSPFAYYHKARPDGPARRSEFPTPGKRGSPRILWGLGLGRCGQFGSKSTGSTGFSFRDLETGTHRFVQKHVDTSGSPRSWITGNLAF